MWPESKNQDNLNTLLFMDGNNMYRVNLLLSYVYIFSILNLFYNQHMYTAKIKKKKKRREFVISTITTFWVQIHVKKQN